VSSGQRLVELVALVGTDRTDRTDRIDRTDQQLFGESSRVPGFQTERKSNRAPWVPGVDF
jgi:hypothetical protein